MDWVKQTIYNKLYELERQKKRWSIERQVLRDLITETGRQKVSSREKGVEK